MILKTIFIFNIICVILAQDFSDSVISEMEEENSSEIAPDYQQNWRVDEDHSDWIPREESDEQPKRRRIRKRKRRPSIEIKDDIELQPKRRPQQRLDQFQDEPLWEEMNSESVQQPYKRRRVLPVYQDEVTEAIRDPFTALLEADEKQRKILNEENTSNGSDLKLLLKQNEGTMSLSEILQKKNLSLSELLMGNQKAISALTERTPEEDVSTEEINFLTTENVFSKYKRLPPSIGLRKNTNKKLGHPDSPLTSRETLEAQRKRLSLLHSHKENKLFADIPKFDVVTEETTDKRIFIPSNVKYTTIDFMPDIQNTERIVNTIASTTPKIVIKKFNYDNRVSFKPKIRLPITSAKMLKLSSRAPQVTVPPTVIKIDIKDILGYNKTVSTEGPMKMSIDLEEMKETTTSVNKIKHKTAKDEIMELLKDPIGKENLSNILKLRNMTIVELVEQRERGSSQVHLADIFHNKTREPEPNDELHIGTINEDISYNFPLVHRKAKQELQSEIVTIQPKETVAITSFPTYKIESDKSIKQRQQPTFMPDWKKLYPTVFQNVYENSDKEQPKTTTEENLKQEQENESTQSINNQLITDEEEFIYLPSGVKSAIIASLAIIGLSLIVFLTILVIFKWNQKNKHILNYSNSFSGSRIKSPILETLHKRSLRNFMTETLGRKKRYHKSHLQNIPDNIWENERKVYM